MKKLLFLLCFSISALTAYVQSKPHDQLVFRHTRTPEEQHKQKSMKPNESKGEVIPTFLPFESSTQDPEEEDMSEENESLVELKQTGPKKLKISEGEEENIPLLLSEEALTQLLQDSEDAEEPVKNNKDDDLEDTKNIKETEMESKEHGEPTNGEIDVRDKTGGENKEDDVGEIDSSTDSEIPMDLDYSSDRDASQQLSIMLKEVKDSTINTLDKKVEKTEEDVIPTDTDYESQQSSNSEDFKKDISSEEQYVPADKHQTQDELLELQDFENDGPHENIEVEKKNSQSETILFSGKKAKKEKKLKNENGHENGKGKKQRKKQNVEDMQKDQAGTMEANKEHSQRTDQEKQVEPTEITIPITRKKKGKWAHLVGMNPVQIKATMELYPDIRPTHRPSGKEVPADLCENFRCKRGKTCKINDENKPNCVCQEPSACPPSLNEFDHVCGTDNNTYDTSCQLFATKCGLEGTKKGHRLHLDYTGSCKFIAPCLERELVQFPLRMRDWLKNVLLQLHEHDSRSPGFLTPKQRMRVQKIYESERRLHAGDHPIELLLQDFEKNYNLYIYPVHWQFAQMDQHPSDRFLSHSELAPLRVPLVPMEHCTSVFFQKCDDDKDKLISFREWCSCFGIKDEDMDVNLLF